MRERYEVLWHGDLPADALVVDDEPDARARIDAHEAEEIRAHLTRLEAEGRRILREPDGSLPPLYRLVDFEASDEALRLRLGRTDYGEYLYTNVARPERRATHGALGMADALAVCAVLITADQRCLFGRRSARIADAGATNAQFHVLPSGHPEPPEDPTAGILNELEEETGVLRSELTEARLTGLVRALPGGKPELTYRLHARLPLAELLGRSPEDAWEFEALDSFPWTGAGVEAWLRAHGETCAAPGLAAVALGWQGPAPWVGRP